MKVTVLFEDDKKIIDIPKGDNLLKGLIANGFTLSADCGGRGVCGKCKVNLISGNIDADIDNNGDFLSCKATIVDDCKIRLYQLRDIVANNSTEQKVDTNDTYGVAFDLGTTTLAFSLIDTTKKTKIEELARLNNQSVFGADVISRISASNNGNLSKLNEIIINELEDALKYFIAKYQISIDKVIISGNTTMLHLFMNVSPKSIGEYPFEPQFLNRITVSGNKLKLSCNTVEILPSFSAYVGADITSGVYHLDLQDNEMLVDLGTNGELIYRKNGRYFATSTAAGPCLEGATIECGVGGVKGAISKVNYDGAITFNTIGNYKAVGICGAGLVDLIATLLKQGDIDYSGSMDKDRFYLTNDIYLSSADVREFQLAKSAICSGIQTLLLETGTKAEDITKFYLAGGIGYHIDIDNAIFVGLLPKEATGKVYVSGNSSLLGAEKCLVNEGAIDKMQSIASNVTIVDLNESNSFSENYVANMFFE